MSGSIYIAQAIFFVSSASKKLPTAMLCIAGIAIVIRAGLSISAGF